MDLTKFPMDSQTCQLVYESFNYNMDEVKMIWMPIPEPVYPLKNITLPDYDLLNVNTTYAEVDYPAGKWIELTVVFTFKRRYVWYFLQAYIPTYLTIFLSWVSFTLGTKAIPARTMLGVNSLLAMMFQFGTIMRNLPRVSYVKAIDVWMLACMTFIFASLLELAIIGYLTKETVTAPGKAKSSEKNKGSNSISDTSNGKPFACFTKKIVIASKLIGIGSNATSNDNHNINNNSHQTRIVQNNNELWNSNNDNNSNSNNNPPLKDWLSTTPSHSNRFPVAFYDSEPQRLAGEQRSIDDLQQLPPQPKLILGDINSPNPFSVGQTIVGEEMFPKQRRPHSSTASPWRAPRLMSQDPIHNFAKVHHLEEPLVEKDSGPKEALEDKFRFDPTAGCPCCNRRKENKICNIRFCPEKIDHISSVGFPLVFSIFNITYWTYYNQ